MVRLAVTREGHVDVGSWKRPSAQLLPMRPWCAQKQMQPHDGGCERDRALALAARRCRHAGSAAGKLRHGRPARDPGSCAVQRPSRGFMR